jgi:NTE family protein
VPNLFIPPLIRGQEYLDGGLTSPVPVKLARAMGADIVIAVDVSWFAQSRNAASGGMAHHGRSGRYALLSEELDQADAVVTPRTVYTRLLDFENKVANIAAGEAAGRSALAKVRDAIARAAAEKQGRTRTAEKQ